MLPLRPSAPLRSAPPLSQFPPSTTAMPIVNRRVATETLLPVPVPPRSSRSSGIDAIAIGDPPPVCLESAVARTAKRRRLTSLGFLILRGGSRKMGGAEAMRGSDRGTNGRETVTGMGGKRWRSMRSTRNLFDRCRCRCRCRPGW